MKQNNCRKTILLVLFSIFIAAYVLPILTYVISIFSFLNVYCNKTNQKDREFSVFYYGELLKEVAEKTEIKPTEVVKQVSIFRSSELSSLLQTSKPITEVPTDKPQINIVDEITQVPVSSRNTTDVWDCKYF